MGALSCDSGLKATALAPGTCPSALQVLLLKASSCHESTVREVEILKQPWQRLNEGVRRFREEAMFAWVCYTSLESP